MQLDDILRTIDTVLSSPPLPSAILDQCKIFLFTTTSPPPGRLKGTQKGAPKERVVSVVVSQPIKWAMRVLKPNEGKGGQVVDSGEGVLCEYVNPRFYVLIIKTNELDQHPYQHLLAFTDYSPSQLTDL